MSDLVRVLYIDEDPDLSRLVQRHLARVGCEVRLAAGGEQGLMMAAGGGFDVVALGADADGRDMLGLLDELLGLPDAPPVIFIARPEALRLAVAALRQGAVAYVVQDAGSGFLDLLDGAIRRTLARERLRHERDHLERELHESQMRLERFAQRQSVLLREVNHRVANSLQLITSLMELQARRLPDPGARDALRQAVERVEAVMLVHRRLYTEDDVGLVEMHLYLTGLIDELRRAVHQEGGVTIELGAEAIRIETDKAIPLGLIVNEWVTNALKYAYPETRPGQDAKAGRIRVSFGRSGLETLRLVVEDDGVGLPQEGAGQGPRGSGLGGMIVSSMAQTIRATVELDRLHRGTRFVLSLPG